MSLSQLVLFTDFGSNGPYVGQVKSVLHTLAPRHHVVDLLNDVPPFSAKAAGFLLAAYSHAFPVGTVFLSIIDPGVGSCREAVVLDVGGRWFVGPNNGLFNALTVQERCWNMRLITWRPTPLSCSFHGRDLFAPVAAGLATDSLSCGWLGDNTVPHGEDIEADVDEFIYIDPFGNAITGRRASTVSGSVLSVGPHLLKQQATFSDVAAGQAFWYENSNGLVEVAVNQGHAASKMQISIGDRYRFI